MRKRTLASLGGAAALAIAFGTTGANAYSTVIYDATAVGPNDDYSRIQTYQGASAITPSTWGDELGGENGFRTAGIGVDWGFTGTTISNVTFTLYTNYALAGSVVGGKFVGFADLFIDLGGNGTFDKAIDFQSEVQGGPTGGAQLVDLSTPGIGVLTSVDQFKTTNLLYGGATNVCNANTDAACLAGSRAPETKVTGNSTYVLTVIDGGSGTLVGPGGSQSYTHSYSVTLSGIDFTGWDNLRLFWGTGWCANDTVEGTAVVPVPAALPIMAAALAGFGFAGWRRNRRAA